MIWKANSSIFVSRFYLNLLLYFSFYLSFIFALSFIPTLSMGSCTDCYNLIWQSGLNIKLVLLLGRAGRGLAGTIFSQRTDQDG